MFINNSSYSIGSIGNINNYATRPSRFTIIITKKRGLLRKQFYYYILSRLFFMIIAICLSSIILPYYTYDDLNMYSTVTLDTIDPMFYLRQRQSWMVICAALNSVWLFKVIQLPRLINIIVGWMVVKELRHTMELMNFDERLIKKVINFIIFFPIYIIFTCSLVKEIIFLWCIWGLINQMFELIDKHHINIFKAIFCSVLGMTFRFGVIESLLGVMFVVYIWRSRGLRQIVAIFAVIVLAIVAVRLWGITGGDVIFKQKTRIYLGAENENLGTKSFFGIIIDIILKLFGAGPRLHPQEGKILWISFLGYLSFFNIYILYWFFIGLFQQKKWKEWFLLSFIAVWLIFLSYMDSIIYRQILFLQPILWILGGKALYGNYSINRMIYKYGSVLIPMAIYLIMFLYVRM